MEQNLDENENAGCDPATRPPASPIPAGYSSLSYTKCDKTTVPPSWYWYDPSVAIQE